jgi:hypothetical protein
MISLEETALLIKKLIEEQTPVLGYLATVDGSNGKLSGCVDSCTPDGGVVVVGKKGEHGSMSANLCLFFGASDNLEAWFGTAQELPEQARDAASTRWGNTVLTLRARSTRSRLVLFFNS